MLSLIPLLFIPPICLLRGLGSTCEEVQEDFFPVVCKWRRNRHHPSIRSIRDECDNANRRINGNNTSFSESYQIYSKICDMVDCSNGTCEHDPIRYMSPMLHATFCLQPPWDIPTRRSTFDAITAGCIPVFFQELSVKM
ncbi:hypothetical protein V6N13_047060 [Hibiscus sabdariffa]|uniref:Exostosin GT47 domain-containing protein n=1 Tax=Hibiscus sabdariffa TaxID=183260 RepID=A0ABR2CC11_9ROSI